MTWQEILGIQWPQNQCDQSGECCRGAAQIAPWKNLLVQAAQGSLTARNFLNQYQPYASRELAQQNAPDAVQASLEIVAQRGEKPDDVIFYRCIYLKDRSECQIYEDRPQLCRDFPESPFGAIPRCCGYYVSKVDCQQKASDLREELARLKEMQAKLKTHRSSESP